MTIRDGVVGALQGLGTGQLAETLPAVDEGGRHAALRLGDVGEGPGRNRGRLDLLTPPAAVRFSARE